MRQPVTERTVGGPWACRPRHCCLSHQVIPLNYLQNEAIFMLDVCGCRYSPWPAVNGFIKCLFSVQFPGYKRTHTHTHTRWFLWFTGTLHRRNGFYTVQTVCAIALHLNLALTGDCALLLSHSVWFISVLNYGDTENVLINHLLFVIPMSYPCHYTHLCPHKPHTHTHTHARMHTHTHTDREREINAFSLEMEASQTAGLQAESPSQSVSSITAALQQSLRKEKAENSAAWLSSWEKVPYPLISTAFASVPTHSLHHLPLLMSLVRVLVLVVGLDAEHVWDWLSCCLTRVLWSSARLARAALSWPRNSSILPCSSCSSSSHGVESPEQAGGESTKLRLGLGPPLEHNWVGGLPTNPRRPLSGPVGGAWSW